MSNFTHIQTRFQNLFYLEKALSKLNINFEKQRKLMDNSKSHETNLGIPLFTSYNLEFSWNEQEYAGQVIIGESQKIGFQSVKYQQNSLSV